MTSSDSSHLNNPNTHELAKAITSLKIASALLTEALDQQPKNIEMHKALRDSCIQRFEFCVELSWKTAVKVLGLEIKSPNTAIRDMARNNLIEDTEFWFELLIARNKTSHSYDEDIAKEVYRVSQLAIPYFEKLVIKLNEVLK